MVNSGPSNVLRKVFYGIKQKSYDETASHLFGNSGSGSARLVLRASGMKSVPGRTNNACLFTTSTFALPT